MKGMLVPAALASFIFQIIVHDPVSYVQSTEWNSTSGMMKNIYQWECSDLNTIHFWGYQETIQQCIERDPSEHQLPGCGMSCQAT